jgi:orotidine-5'-phosphate decarboxylase
MPAANPPTPPAAAPGPLHRVAVALDTPDRPTFRRWCRLFAPRVGVLKIGLEAFVRWGPPAVEEAAGHGAELFLDLKLHDIPRTVAGAVGSARSLGVRYLTVHAGGGPAMLEAAVEAAGGEVGLLGVTLLTHLDAGELAALDLPGGGEERVRRWAALAARAGCAGVVCSPLEAAALRHRHPRPFRLVTPGVRPAGTGRDDQRRVATPAQALGAGSDLLVVGRPLTAAADPVAALDALQAELAAAGAAAGDQ